MGSEDGEEGATQLLAAAVISEFREQHEAERACFLKLTDSLNDIKMKKDSLFSMRSEDIQVDYVADPYAYNVDDYTYDYNEASGGVASGLTVECSEEEKQQWTEEERQLYEWQCQQQQDEHLVEQATEYWEDATDWVRHFDNSAEKYFYYSESLQESRWEE
jgi:hypothetical protein